jgi:hypothetical protein
MKDSKRCPVCGVGVLRHLGTETGDAPQVAEIPIGETFTCGHEVAGPTLATADAERLEVERRTSEETVEPVDGA